VDVGGVTDSSNPDRKPLAGCAQCIYHGHMGGSEPGLVYFTELGAGPPVLLVHGLMVTGEMSAPVLSTSSPSIV
jgi:hypothetical protein